MRQHFADFEEGVGLANEMETLREGAGDYSVYFGQARQRSDHCDAGGVGATTRPFTK